MKIISEDEARLYEIGKGSFIGSFINIWFPKYLIKKWKRNYKRYLGFMTYNELTKMKVKEERESLSKIYN